MKYIILTMLAVSWLFIPDGSVAFAATPTPTPSATPSVTPSVTPTPTPEPRVIQDNDFRVQLAGVMLYGDNSGSPVKVKVNAQGYLLTMSIPTPTATPTVTPTPAP